MSPESVYSEHVGGAGIEVSKTPTSLRNQASPPPGLNASLPPGGGLRGGHCRTPQTASYLSPHRTSKGHDFNHLPRIEQGMAKSKGSHHNDESAVARPDAAVVKDSKPKSLTQRPKKTSPKEKDVSRCSAQGKSAMRPSPPEKIRTPGLVIHRQKRASTSSIPIELPLLSFECSSPSSRDSATSHGNKDETRPPPKMDSSSLTTHTDSSRSADQPTTTTNTVTATTRTSISTNPKVARVRAGCLTPLTPLTPLTIPTSIPVTLSLPGSDHPVTAMGTITLPQGVLPLDQKRAISRQGTSSTASAPMGTNLARFKHLIDADLPRWGHIERELGKRDIPLDALSTEQMGDLMSEKNTSRLESLLAELEKVQMADAFEHVTSPMGDMENPKLYSFRYSHGKPLGEVYTYRPPSHSSLSGVGNGNGNGYGKKTIKELVRDGKDWGRRNRYARVCRVGFAVLGGVGVLGGVVAVCYFRVGQIGAKKGFVHES